MYFVFILYSQKCNRYIGYSANVKERLLRHNSGYVPASKNCFPYQLMATKAFSTEGEAMKEEKRLKSMKSRIYLEKIIEGNW
jgi:putative endonuclease